MRYLLSLSLVVLAFIANARQITPDEAIAAAQDFFNNSSVEPSCAPRAIRARSLNTAQTEESAPYYIFNASDNNGFVIISGDDRAKKILGYSDKGNFDVTNIPPQLSAMLDCYAESLSKLSGSTSDVSWTAPNSAANSNGGVLLETANWGQGYPYNAKCPIIDGVQAPTGCVATAMAIVMKYHNWPEKYDWGTMNVENVDNISNFMYECANNLETEFGKDVSKAFTYKLWEQFPSNYSYNCEGHYFCDYQGESFHMMLHDNIDMHRPMIASGFNSGKVGAHVFIIDGYDRDNLYHINWGWDGAFNGYYPLNFLSPDDIDFYPQDLYCQITPLYSNNSPFTMTYKDDENPTYSLDGGLQINTNKITPNANFLCSSQYLTSPFKPFLGEVGIALVHNNQIKEVTGISRCNYDSKTGFYPVFECAFKSMISDNDRIQIVTKEDGDNWKLVIGTNLSKSYIDIKELSNSISPEIKFEFDDSRINLSYWDWHKTHIPIEYSGITVNFLKGQKTTIYVEPKDNTIRKKILVRITDTTHSTPDIYFSTYNNDSPSFFSLLFLNGPQYVVSANFVDNLSAEYYVDIPGTFHSLEISEDLLTISDLTLHGNINATDLWYIRDNFPSLESLNLSDVSIYECVSPSLPGDRNNVFCGSNYLPTQAISPINISKEISRIVLPDNLVGIHNHALQNLNRLEVIDLPSTLKQIEYGAFTFGVGQMHTIICRATFPPEGNGFVFNNPDKYSGPTNLYVPDESLDIYKSDDNWNWIPNIKPLSQFANIPDVDIDEPNMLITLFNLQGIKVFQGNALNTATLPSGIYLKQVGDKVDKIVIR